MHDLARIVSGLADQESAEMYRNREVTLFKNYLEETIIKVQGILKKLSQEYPEVVHQTTETYLANKECERNSEDNQTSLFDD